MRAALQLQVSTHPEFQQLFRHIKGEIGLVFTNGVIFDIKTKLEAEKDATAAKLNSRTPVDIYLRQGDTPLEPTQTAFFGALGIPTKISRGKIYFITDVKLFGKGELITQPGYTLLRALQLKPITRQVKVMCAYDKGIMLDEKALDQETPQHIQNAFCAGIQFVAAVSVEIGVTNKSTILHMIKRGLENVRAVSAALDLKLINE